MSAPLSLTSGQLRDIAAYSGDNLYIPPSRANNRMCRTCRRDQKRRTKEMAA